MKQRYYILLGRESKDETGVTIANPQPTSGTIDGAPKTQTPSRAEHGPEGVFVLRRATACLSIPVRPATLVVFALLVMPMVPRPVQAGHPKVERYSKTPEAEKINVNLLRLDEKVRTEGVSLAAAAASMGIVTLDSGVMLDILVSHLDPSVEKKFELTGVTVRHFSAKYNRVSVVIDDPSLLYELAKIPEVRRILPEYGGTTGAVGSPAKAVPTAPGSSCGKATSGGEELPAALSE